MDRNRDARRAIPNGLSRRRHRNNSLRDSPEDDGPMELQETSRLRDRGGSGKKDRDRDRERDRDRDRDRDRMNRNKRRRAERLMHGSNREDGGDDSSEESVNDEDEDEDEYDDGRGGGGSIRMLPPNPPTTSISSSSSLLNHWKSFPPVNNKHFRPLPALKVTDEMIGVSVPRKARTASTKRSHEWPSSCGVVGDQFHRHASTSPVRPSTSSMAAPSPAPTSPSSSHASIRKKPRPNGPRLKPPKMSSAVTKSSPSAQDEIEIEIAEVLYGMMRQPQGPSKQETTTATDSTKLESRETNKSTSDAKSRVSSPISNSPCAPPHQLTSSFPQNSSSSTTSISATAPKRKRPRVPTKYDEEHPTIFPADSSAISTTHKVVAVQSMKIEASSSTLEKTPGSVPENGVFSYKLSNSHAILAPEARPEPVKESMKPESKAVSDSKKARIDESQSQNLKQRKDEAQSPKKESPVFRLDDNRGDMTATTKANSSISEIENHREEKKFQIDLMAPPPLRSSPERDGEVDYVSVDPKPTVTVAETELKSMMTREDDKALKFGKEEQQPANVETKKSNKAVSALLVEEAAEFKKPVVGGKERNIDLQLDLEKTDRDSGNASFSKERNIDLQLDLEKTDRDSGNASFSGNKLPQHHVTTKQQQSTEKPALQPSSVPLPMSVPAGWPGGISPMGYMAPLQGVVSMDGTVVPPAAMQPPQVLFNQPRPKRCATHCYIARNIYYHQQMSKMNPFWPVAAGSGSLYGPKHLNPSVIPPEFHGNIPGRGVNSAPDKGQGLAMFPAQPGKEKASPATNLVDSQRKQIVIQQALPPGGPSNILQGPTIIFPLSQQQAAAAASVRPGSVKSPNAASAPLPNSVNSASVSGGATPAVAPAMSFNYPGNEPQYLAILQNNAYPFSMPAHVGAPPAYRGPHAQTLPYFSGSFYSSQMLHPTQVQQQQQQQQQPPSQSQQAQQGHQNPSISSGSSSSQKHLQNQQQRPPSNGVNGGNGGLQGFPASKNPSSQTLQLQQHQRQHQQNPHAPHQARQLEHEMGGEDSPSTADSRISRHIYAQNFAMPMPPPNFALMTPPMGASGATAASGSEKKQQQGSKAEVEASQTFAMSFALNGANAATGLDMASLAQSQAILQSLTEVTRQGYQHKKNYRHPEEGKSGGGDSSHVEEERKAMTGKASAVGHSIAFSSDGSASTIPGNNVLDSSAPRSLNLSSAPGRTSSSVVPASVTAVNALTPQQQYQQQLRNHQQQQYQQQLRNHQQQQMQQQLQQQHQMQQQLQQQHQMHQLQKQQLQQNAARNKTPATSNGSVYSDHLPSTSSMAAKFPNALSSFPQNLVQSSTSPSQSPQWKNSSRTITSQVPASSQASSTSSSLKSYPQKQARTQQSHTQISFAANPKSSTQNQGIQPNSNQPPSPPIMVGSPTTTTSSMSKSAGGSPRKNTSNSTGNKAGQASSLSSQQVKNSPSVPSQKSSPVGGRNVPSSLGNTHITSSTSGTKSQLTLQQQHQQHQHQQQQQQHLHQQQQVSKQSIQQAQLYFSNAYMQNQQAAHSTSTGGTASPSSGYYVPTRRRGDVQQQSQHSQGSSGTSASGMLSLCPPVTLANNTGTTDPAKAVAAAANSMKGGGLSSQPLIHHAQFAAAQSSGPHQLVPTGFPYVHAIPTVVQMKPAEQKKQPAGE